MLMIYKGLLNNFRKFANKNAYLLEFKMRKLLFNPILIIGSTCIPTLVIAEMN